MAPALHRLRAWPDAPVFKEPLAFGNKDQINAVRSYEKELEEQALPDCGECDGLGYFEEECGACHGSGKCKSEENK